MKKTATRKMSKEYNQKIHRRENANGLLMKIGSSSLVIKDKMIETMRSLKKKSYWQKYERSYSVLQLEPTSNGLDFIPNCGLCLASFLNIKVYIPFEWIIWSGLSPLKMKVSSEK